MLGAFRQVQMHYLGVRVDVHLCLVPARGHPSIKHRAVAGFPARKLPQVGPRFVRLCVEPQINHVEGQRSRYGHSHPRSI